MDEREDQLRELEQQLLAKTSELNTMREQISSHDEQRKHMLEEMAANNNKLEQLEELKVA